MGTGGSVQRSTHSVLNEVEKLNEQVIDIQVGKRGLHLSTHMVKSAVG